MNNQTDHDLLICIDVKLKELREDFKNHLSHHFRYNVMAWSVALGAIVSLVLVIVKIL